MDRPKGTAFVKFDTSESASACIKSSESSDGLWLDERQIYACEAMTKDDADTAQKKKKEKEKKDSR